MSLLSYCKTSHDSFGVCILEYSIILMSMLYLEIIVDGQKKAHLKGIDKKIFVGKKKQCT